MAEELATSPKIQELTSNIFQSVVSEASATKPTVPEVAQPFGSPAPPSPIDQISKTLDFGGPGKAEPATPATPAIGNAAAAKSDDGVDYDQFIKDTFLWTNKVRSTIYLLGGLLGLYLAHQALTSKTTLISGVCYVLLAQLALNFLRVTFSPKFQERCTWADSAWTYGFTQSITNTIKAAAVLHDKHLLGVDASKTLKIGGGLWALSLLGRLINATTLAIVLWVGAFIVPKLYFLFKDKVDKAAQDGYSQAKTKFDTMDRKLKAGVIMGPLLVAGYLLSRADLAIAGLLMLAYARYWLKPAEMEALNKRVEPVTATVSKVGGNISKIMGGYAEKFDLTPTPMRKKRE